MCTHVSMWIEDRNGTSTRRNWERAREKIEEEKGEWPWASAFTALRGEFVFRVRLFLGAEPERKTTPLRLSVHNKDNALSKLIDSGYPQRTQTLRGGEASSSLSVRRVRFLLRERRAWNRRFWTALASVFIERLDSDTLRDASRRRARRSRRRESCEQRDGRRHFCDRRESVSYSRYTKDGTKVLE